MWSLRACLSSLVFLAVPLFQPQLLSPSVRCAFTRLSTSFSAKCLNVHTHLMKRKLGTRNATGQTLKTLFGYCCFPLANVSISWSLNDCGSILFLGGAVVGNSSFKWPLSSLTVSALVGFLCSSVLQHHHLQTSHHLPTTQNCLIPDTSLTTGVPHCRKPGQHESPYPWVPPTDSHRGEVSFYSTAFLCKTNFWPSLLVGKGEAHTKVGAECGPS